MKVVAMLLMLVGLCSCTQVPAGTPSITSNPEAICTIGGEVVKAFEFEYKGHSYTWFHRRGGWDGNDGIVHNPDCRCNKK